MARNIHQRRTKNHKDYKATQVARPTEIYSGEETMEQVSVAAAVPPAKHSVVMGKGGISQDVMDARAAELPWELKRISFFSAAVVILLVVLWFILR
ncbi:MAG: hypothetical protein FWF98_01125 [Dehalococcoidia bacterium]|nr:hypothetical protein [Dehalococcoidia bacterium]